MRWAGVMQCVKSMITYIYYINIYKNIYSDSTSPPNLLNYMGTENFFRNKVLVYHNLLVCFGFRESLSQATALSEWLHYLRPSTPCLTHRILVGQRL